MIGRRLVGLSLGFALSLVLPACMGDDGDEGRISGRDLRNLVLQPDDLPPMFTQFDFGELALTDVRPGPRQDESRFGRLGGWKARYRRSGTAETAGPLVVESRVDLFDEEDGAELDLEAYEVELEQIVERSTGPGRSLEPPELGESSTAITLTQGSGRVAVRFFTVAWRRAEVTASISVNGFERKLAFGDAVALARKQDRRLTQALAR